MIHHIFLRRHRYWIVLVINRSIFSCGAIMSNYVLKVSISVHPLFLSICWHISKIMTFERDPHGRDGSQIGWFRKKRRCSRAIVDRHMLICTTNPAQFWWVNVQSNSNGFSENNHQNNSSPNPVTFWWSKYILNCTTNPVKSWWTIVLFLFLSYRLHTYVMYTPIHCVSGHILGLVWIGDAVMIV